jgi:mycothiol synthase
VTIEPGTVEVRKPGPRDAGAIAELVNAQARAAYGEDVVTAAEIEHWLRLPRVEFWVAEAAAGELVAYVDVSEEAEQTRFWIDVREHPERRGRGGAGALLAEAERWARGQARPGALLRGTCYAPDGVLRELYESSGFGLVRHALEMHIELGVEPPEPDWPVGISVRTFDPRTDQERVYEADMEAFQDHWEFVHEPLDDYRIEYFEHPGFDSTLCFVAEDEGEISGYCLGRVHASGDPAHGYVSSLAVRRPWRRRGLGLAFLHNAFREFRRRGMTQAGLDVDAENLTGAVRLYERAGMRVAKRADIYEKALPP